METRPGYSPGDIFWRQSGGIWFQYVWKPFWDLLNKIEQDNYLKHLVRSLTIGKISILIQILKNFFNPVMRIVFI